jgi:hypothetical protein
MVVDPNTMIQPIVHLKKINTDHNMVDRTALLMTTTDLGDRLDGEV